jgi:excisionase family DNA binding protein
MSYNILRYTNNIKGAWSMEKEYLTTEDLCKRFKVTRKTIDRWRKGGLPFVKIRGSIRFEEKAVEQWTKEQQK